MKNRTDLNIVAKNSLGCMERILRLIRHRGFEVTFFHADNFDCEEALNITVQIESERCDNNLKKQLQKLIDVIEVERPFHSQIRSSLGHG